MKKIELYPAQHDFVSSRARFTGFIGGIGSGKTYAGAVRTLLAAWETRGLLLVVSPTYPMLRDAALRSFMEVAGEAMVNFHKSEMLATLAGGAEVIFRSADKPDRLRGPNIHACWLDEAALCPAGTWEVVIGRLRADGKAGPCWITTTPKGRNWLWEKREQIRIYRARTRDNPYLAPEFVQSLEDAYTGDFARQELEGEFITFEGLVYEEFRRNVHVAERAGPWQRVVVGVDEGYTNPAVLLAVGVDTDGRAHIIEEFYKRRVLQGDVVAEAVRMHKAHGVEAFQVDPSAAGLIAEMRSVGLPVRAANHAVTPGIQGVKARLAVQGDGRPRLTVDPACANTLAEFESYVWKGGRSGSKDEPEKVNDHAMDALRYVVNSLATGGWVRGPAR